ncbi:hypothetical protein B0H21DRAFT_825239 [Amylocystis lapponica]|nr:hypothetical protein B0H21DRAFT_825239 [Amylocystis lapponica]
MYSTGDQQFTPHCSDLSLPERHTSPIAPNNVLVFVVELREPCLEISLSTNRLRIITVVSVSLSSKCDPVFAHFGACSPTSLPVRRVETLRPPLAPSRLVGYRTTRNTVQPPSDLNLSSFFLQTYHVAQAQGATLNLSFTGSAIALFAFKGPGHIRVACGCPIMMFTIPNTGKLQRAGAWLDFNFVQITNESLSAAASTPVATGVLLWATPMHQHHSSEWLQETHPQIEWLHKILFGLSQRLSLKPMQSMQ